MSVEATAASPAAKCHLLRLPSELRLPIHKLLAKESTVRLVLYNGSGILRPNNPPERYKGLALLVRTCRLIHSEALDVLLSDTLVILNLVDDISKLDGSNLGAISNNAFLGRIKTYKIYCGPMTTFREPFDLGMIRDFLAVTRNLSGVKHLTLDFWPWRDPTNDHQRIMAELMSVRCSGIVEMSLSFSMFVPSHWRVSVRESFEKLRGQLDG